MLNEESLNILREKVLDILKEGEKSTTEIASKINRNHYSTVNILEELLLENKIEKTEINKFTFWKIKDETDIKYEN